MCHCAKQGSKAKIQHHPAGHPAGFPVPWQPLPLSLQEQHPYFYRANPGQRAGVALIHPSNRQGLVLVTELCFAEQLAMFQLATVRHILTFLLAERRVCYLNILWKNTWKRRCGRMARVDSGEETSRGHCLFVQKDTNKKLMLRDRCIFKKLRLITAESVFVKIGIPWE